MSKTPGKMTKAQHEEGPGPEPTFTLRASDDNAPRFLREWAQNLRYMRQPEVRAREAFEAADAMEAWQKRRDGR